MVGNKTIIYNFYTNYNENYTSIFRKLEGKI